MVSKIIYSDSQLKKLKQTELDILSEIIRIVTKHNIQYFTVGGTTLGAIRHNGFIPWDDDIDIGMLRKDYNRFLSVAEKELNGKYYLLNFNKNKNFPSYFTKVFKKGTKFVEEESRKLKYEKGIFVDIFPFDNLPNDDKQRKKYEHKIYRLNQLFKSKILWKISNVSVSDRSLVKKIIRVVLHLLLIPVSRRFLYKKLDKAMTKYNDINCLFVSSAGQKYHENLLTNLIPTKPHKFEYLEVMVPNDFDAVLKNQYGDYMKLPPVERRKTHLPVELDFGDN